MRIAVAVLALIAILPLGVTALATDSTTAMWTPLGSLGQGCDKEPGALSGPQVAWTSDDVDPVRIQVIGPGTNVGPHRVTVPSEEPIKFALDGFDPGYLEISASTALGHEAELKWLTDVLRGGRSSAPDPGLHAGLLFPQSGCYHIDVRGLQDGHPKNVLFPVAVVEGNGVDVSELRRGIIAASTAARFSVP